MNSQSLQTALSQIQIENSILLQERQDSTCCQLLEICDQVNISNKAKYLSRSLLHSAFLLQQDLTAQCFQRTLIACLSKALHLNKTLGNKNQSVFEEAIQSRIKEDKIANFITRLERSHFEDSPEDPSKWTVKSILQKTTAYDLLEKLEPHQFPGINFEQLVIGMQDTINLALAYPLFRQFSVEEVFRACLQAFLKQKMPDLNNPFLVFGVDLAPVTAESQQKIECLLSYMKQCLQ